MSKAAEAFRTISEVADDLEIPKHVLRFWEVKFTQIRPMKRGGGRRYYRPEDMELLRGIRHLLHREGYTIKGVQKILKEQGVEAVKVHGRTNNADGASPPLPMAPMIAALPAVPPVPSVRMKPNSRKGNGTKPTATSAVPATAQAKPEIVGVGRPTQKEALRRIISELEVCRAALLGSASITEAAVLPPVLRRAASGS
jgi:DNA-binding transcriptional MerR regulator